MKKYTVLISLFLSLLLVSSTSLALCVKVPEANLRRGPGVKFDKTWEVFKYMPFKRMEKKGDWYKVKDVDSDIHWIYRNLVTSKHSCAVVKVDKANVRTGPGTKHGKNALSPALKYDSFKVLTKKAAWVQVMDEFGDKGWIFRKLLWIQ